MNNLGLLSLTNKKKKHIRLLNDMGHGQFKVTLQFHKIAYFLSLDRLKERFQY